MIKLEIPYPTIDNTYYARERTKTSWTVHLEYDSTNISCCPDRGLFTSKAIPAVQEYKFKQNVCRQTYSDRSPSASFCAYITIKAPRLDLSDDLISATMLNIAFMKFQLIGISRDESSSKSLCVRPCLPYRTAKTTCSRGFPTCGACLRRKRSSSCIYENLSPVNRTRTTIQKGIPNAQANNNSMPCEQSFADILQHVKDGLESPKTMTKKSCINVGHSANWRHIQISEPLSPEENKDSTTSTAIIESNNEGIARHELHSPRMSQAKQEKKPFSESHLPVMLNFGQQSASAY